MSSVPAASSECQSAASAQALMAAWRRSYAGAQPAPWTARHMAIGPGDPDGRAGADALAAWQRRHPPAIDAWFSAEQWPWYAVLERARVETLAGQHLPGIALNLGRPQDLQPAAPALARLYLQARQALAGLAPAPAEAQLADTLDQARALLADAAGFAREVGPLVQALAPAARLRLALRQ